METSTSHSSPDPPKQKHGGDQTGTVTPGRILSRQIPVLPDGSIPMPLGSGTIISVLGEGGAAIVYEIWVEKLGITRAVKVLKPNATIETTDRFMTEMRITAQLRHPNIIEIHDVGEWHSLPYIEMEKIDGSSLETVIHERGTLPLKICTSIGILVCRALIFMHNHTYLINEKNHVGILHRDLKPGNIMLSKNGIIKLMDFGIATPTGVSMHTMEGSVVGSMQYISPELLEGAKPASARSDIFSFGCVLYEMITGQRTFSEQNMAKLVAIRMKNSYRPLSEFNVKCPRQLVKLVNACLTHKPDRRITSAAEILLRLEKIHARLSKNKPEDLVEQYISSNMEKSTVAFRRLPPYKTAVTALVVCLIAVAVYLAAPYLAGSMRSGEHPKSRNASAVPNHPPDVPRQGNVGDLRHHPGGIMLPTLKQGDREKSLPSGEIQSSRVANILSIPAKDHSPAKALQGGTGDPVAALAEKNEKGDYAGALRAFDALDQESAATVRARLYKLRALLGHRNNEALTAFFLRPDVPDKEYYLAKAQFFTGLKRYVEAVAQCDKGRQVPASLGDAVVSDQTLSYVKASCLTSLFMIEPTEEARKLALDGWVDVKYLLRKNRENPYYVLAEKNIDLLISQAKNDVHE